MWQTITSAKELEELLNRNSEKFFLFKHSPRCSISTMAKKRLERSDYDEKILLVDVVENKELSDALASHYQEKHESPQLLLIDDGKCVFAASHNAITSDLLTNSPSSI